MKNIIYYLIVAGFTIFTLASLMTNNKGNFYYAFNEKVPLISKSNTLLVKYAEGVEKEKSEKYLKELLPDVIIKWHSPLLAKIACNSEKSKDELMSKLLLNNTVRACLLFYTLENGISAFVGVVTNKLKILAIFAVK